jgi:sec-independent protein translocase protein TatB
MLPQFGFTEFLLLAIVALIVVGPKDLPMMMRKIGQFVAKGKAMAGEFRAAFDDIARQTELDELREEIEALRRDNAVTEAVDNLKDAEREINDAVMRGPQAQVTPKVEASPDPEPALVEPEPVTPVAPKPKSAMTKPAKSKSAKSKSAKSKPESGLE